MPSIRLTDKQAGSIKPLKGKRVEVFDLQEPGLLLRVSDAGLRTWYFRYRLADGRQPRLKLGTYPSTGVADARLRAQGARGLVEAGKDPAAIERQQEAEAKAQKIRTYDDLVEAYFAACRAGTYTPRGKRKKDATIEAEEALYERHIRREFAKRPFREIGRAEIRTLTRAMRAKGITTQANHAHALIRQTYSYALDEEMVEINPAMGLAAPAPKKVRQRTLPDEEMKALWSALKAPKSIKKDDGKTLAMTTAMGIALRLTMLLLQRRVEVATMREQDLDLTHGTWTIPADVAKNGRAHVVQLPPEAVLLIKEALKLARGDRGNRQPEFVFPSPRDKEKPVHPDALTRAMGNAMHALKLPLAGPHDLRQRHGIREALHSAFRHQPGAESRHRRRRGLRHDASTLQSLPRCQREAAGARSLGAFAVGNRG